MGPFPDHHATRLDGWSPRRLELGPVALVAAGFAGVIWTLVLHFAEAPQGWQLELTPRYLLTRGPYRFTRNPIYLAYAPLWFGWGSSIAAWPC